MSRKRKQLNDVAIPISSSSSSSAPNPNRTPPRRHSSSPLILSNEPKSPVFSSPIQPHLLRAEYEETAIFDVPFTSQPPNRAPHRTTLSKVPNPTPKIVLFPEDSVPSFHLGAPILDANREAEGWDTEDSEGHIRTVAERMSRDDRENVDMPRVTAYITAESYNMKALTTYLVTEQRIQAKYYDECIYAPYTTYENSPLFSTPITSYPMPPIPRYAPADIPPSYGEVFFFEYGVTVFWNFTSLQEAEILRSIKPFEQQPISESETQIENFWFQYDTLPNYQPRIYNDMITLKTGNHMVKLTISHALSQSVKLTLYEGKIDDSLDETKHLPRLLAARGDVKMSRRDITKLIGKLFKVRMSVNLVSNVLDIPELFWAEPSLEPLYHAIVSYLEIPQRVKTVNLRTEVISDLLDMLSSHMNSSKMDYLTWIIIILIAVDVVVLLLEIFVKAIKTQT